MKVLITVTTDSDVQQFIVEDGYELHMEKDIATKAKSFSVSAQAMHSADCYRLGEIPGPVMEYGERVDWMRRKHPQLDMWAMRDATVYSHVYQFVKQNQNFVDMLIELVGRLADEKQRYLQLAENATNMNMFVSRPQPIAVTDKELAIIEDSTRNALPLPMLLSGQEWYDKFTKELFAYLDCEPDDYPWRLDGYKTTAIINAAKKAAGIK